MKSFYKHLYNPGKGKLVADILSRQFIHSLDSEPKPDVATIHHQSFTHTLETVEKSINVYRNQIILESGQNAKKKTYVIFGNKFRDFLAYTDTDNDSLFKMLLSLVKYYMVKLFLASDHCWRKFNISYHHININSFTHIFCPKELNEIITQKHNRAHRASH